MDPLITPVILSALVEAGRLGVGAMQNRLGKQVDAQSVRPTDYVTESDKSALMISKMMANLREMPGAGTVMEGAEASAANAIRESKAGGVVDIATINKHLLDIRENIGVKTADMINANTQVLMQSLGRFGALEKDAFTYNEKQKYQENVMQAADLRNSGLTNMFNAGSNMAAAGIGALSTNESMKVFQEMIDLYKDGIGTPINENTGSLSVGTISSPAGKTAMVQNPVQDPTADNPIVYPSQSQSIFDMYLSNPQAFRNAVNPTPAPIPTLLSQITPMPGIKLN